MAYLNLNLKDDGGWKGVDWKYSVNKLRPEEEELGTEVPFEQEMLHVQINQLEEDVDGQRRTSS